MRENVAKSRGRKVLVVGGCSDLQRIRIAGSTIETFSRNFAFFAVEILEEA